MTTEPKTAESQQSRDHRGGDKPLLFVSHKHADAQIARAVADFVRTVTGGQVDVFMSSSPDFESPRVGKALNTELAAALWRAGVVILVYTSQDNDWGWCMWECGLADDASGPETKVVVLQCLDDVPRVFESGVRIQAWEQDSLINLAYRFLEEGFFPRAAGPTTGLKESELKDRAVEFHGALQEVIPREPNENWSTWPFLRLHVPRAQLEAVHATPEDGSVDATVEVLLADAVVAATASGLPSLFGRVEVENGTYFKTLVDEWQEAYPDRKATWLKSMATQILAASRKRRPKVGAWGRFREVEGNDEFSLGIGRVKKDAAELQLDCFFYGLGSVIRVEDRMTRRDKMYAIDLDTTPSTKVVLVDLVGRLEEKGWNRIPILAGNQPKYILHISTVDRFLRRTALEGNDVSSLTLADVLADEDMQSIFAGTYAVVDQGATIADALLKMRDTPRCEDVFIVDAVEGVVGWLTNRDVPIDALRVL